MRLASAYLRHVVLEPLVVLLVSVCVCVCEASYCEPQRRGGRRRSGLDSSRDSTVLVLVVLQLY